MTYTKENIALRMNEIAKDRDAWIKRNSYYYESLINFLKFNIPEGSSVIEIGSGTGYVLDKLNPSSGVGIDISPEMVKIAKKNYPKFEFYEMDAENITLDRKFDFVILTDTIGYFEDIQKVFGKLQKLCYDNTRIIITYINFLWLPILNLGEALKLKMPQMRNNWLNINDISNLLALSDFTVIKTGAKFLVPFYVPLFSNLMNRFVANLPLINKLCLSEFLICKSSLLKSVPDSVSVVIPARNEEGNIEQIVKRVPKMGSDHEIIFIEGHSEDKTLDEIKRIYEKYKNEVSIQYSVQDGEGKADAVRKGFEMAKGKVLMILDADMTVPPEDLSKFYEAIVSGKGEFLNGSRLVYPLEKDSMRTLNIIGNKFFSVMFTWILNQRIKDTLCGTKVITKANYEKLKLNRSFFGDFDPFGDFDLLFGAAKLNLKIIEIPIRYKARVYGETNISRFKHGWMLIKMTVFAMRKFKFN